MNQDEEEMYDDKDEQRRGQAKWGTKVRESAQRVYRGRAKQTKWRVLC